MPAGDEPAAPPEVTSQPDQEETQPEAEAEGEDVQWLAGDKNTYVKPLEQDPQQV